MLLDYYTGTMQAFGLSSPFTRGALGLVGGFAFQMFARPSISYVSHDGQSYAKSFGFGENETIFPWYAWAIVPGTFMFLFL